MFVVEAHDVHHLVLDVAHQVRALGDGDLQVDSNDREVIPRNNGTDQRDGPRFIHVSKISWSIVI